MKSTGLCLIVLLFAAPLLAAVRQPDAADGQAAAPDRGTDDGTVRFAVDCAKGETIGAALIRGRSARRLEIQFNGRCHESPVIDRDDLTLHGTGIGSAVLAGLIDVRGASRAFFSDFTIQGNPNLPFDTAHGGINAIGGASIDVHRVHIKDMKARGLQVIGASARIGDVTIDNAMAGAFVFRAGQIFLDGSLVANNSLFGMSLLYTGADAKKADLTFNNGLLGLLIQVNASLEHVIGSLTTNGNAIGIVIAGHGVLAYSSTVHVENNSQFGIQLDEGSAMTPLLGSLSGGPLLSVVNNPGVGVSVERNSTFGINLTSTITNNSVGVQVDNSFASLAEVTISGNSQADVALTFGAKAEFVGPNVHLGTAVKCDATSVTRGVIGCGTN
jgi:hypothetical protein